MQGKICSMNNPWGKKRQNERMFEDEINRWLSENKGVEIVRVEQSSSGGSFSPSLWMISIWYDEK